MGRIACAANFFGDAADSFACFVDGHGDATRACLGQWRSRESGLACGTQLRREYDRRDCWSIHYRLRVNSKNEYEVYVVVSCDVLLAGGGSRLPAR